MNREEKSKTGDWFGSKDNKDAVQKLSPHPVKPISATLSGWGQEKKPNKQALTAALSSLEVLKSVTGGQQQALKKP
ncbi:rab11 family-interacting 5 [Pelobates cultripes]|uniref:Rab11 family-interacting 5 n=1 Tax=Pelobates cultripes TaxID=61616 RepID=A0AAD1VJ61_PELCU|nr:rab11 family-interacting 5 [Pelobates cultripes]